MLEAIYLFTGVICGMIIMYIWCEYDGRPCSCEGGCCRCCRRSN